MLFSSIVFLFYFLPAVLALYYLFRFNVPIKNTILLIASLFFYAWGEPWFLFVMLASIAGNYVLALLVDKFREKKDIARFFVVLSVILNIGLLFVFKYLDFLIRNINLAAGTDLPLTGFALPIGISFFTFQAMSYVIDVYRGNGEVQKNPFYVALYIAFFPQLIAGPIVRYETIAKQIRHRRESVDKFAVGVCRFISGLGKKVLLSNNFAIVADRIFDSYQNGGCPVTLAWLGSIAYTLQILFDFSGYSDMAIGLGLMFGFKFEENFNYPYISKSIQEFWRRWHISLSTWFKEYVYIPLGGNRKGRMRTYVNLFIVFLLTGFWHGASLTFIFWGLFHGFFMIVERLGFGKVLEKNPLTFLNHIYTWIVVVCGWVLFRMDGMKRGLAFLKAMFLYQKGEYNITACLNAEVVLVLLAGFLLCGVLQSLIPKLKAALFAKEDISVIQMGCLFAIVFLCIISLSADSYNPFIYFRF